MKEYARPDIKINELLQAHPAAFRALLECGMGCVSCPSALVETIEEACMVHRLDVDDVVDYVNHALDEADKSDGSEKKDSVYMVGSGYAGKSLYEASHSVSGDGASDMRSGAVSDGASRTTGYVEKDMEEKMLDFLDANTYADRIKIFETMKGADDRILNNIAVSMDIMLDDRFDSYERIDYELRFRAKFETDRGSRL